jgi:hypothetical protein
LRRFMMKSFSRIVLCLLALVVVAGCASTNVTQQTPMSSPGLARPNQIWVYNFVANPADMPANSSIGGEVGAPSTPPTADQIQQGRQLGALIAQELVADINAMGLSAVQAGPGASPQVGDGVIRGYLVSVQGGSAVQRFVIGFGAGTSEMDTVVEGYAVTPQGWRKLGSGTLSSSGGKTPGWSCRPRWRLPLPTRSALSLSAGRRSIARPAAEADSRGGLRRPPTKLRSSSESDSRIGAGSSERMRGLSGSAAAQVVMLVALRRWSQLGIEALEANCVSALRCVRL